MKITIDTKEDSHEEIRKVMGLLSTLMGEKVRANKGIFSDNSVSETASSGTNAFVNMFGSEPVAESESSATPSVSEEEPVVDLSILNKSVESEDEKEEAEDDPGVTFF